jgi:hypothetical protein
MSLEATIVSLLNQGISKHFATSSNVFRAKHDKYAKSPESMRTPNARYPKSFNAKATAQKLSRPLLKFQNKIVCNLVAFEYASHFIVLLKCV